MNYSSLIWDWNGTLLDDVAIAVETINVMLKKRDISLLTIEKYREVFTFPIKEYYKEIGFNFITESFEVIAMEFIEQYHMRYNDMVLFDRTVDILKYFKDKGMKQYILSAKEENSLKQQVKNFKIDCFFEDIAGINDHYAESKKDRGFQLLKKLIKSIDNEKPLFIGDTLHDYEIAKELGCDCVLIANGHQSFDRLKRTKCRIVKKLNNLKTFVCI